MYCLHAVNMFELQYVHVGDIVSETGTNACAFLVKSCFNLLLTVLHINISLHISFHTFVVDLFLLFG